MMPADTAPMAGPATLVADPPSADATGHPLRSGRAPGRVGSLAALVAAAAVVTVATVLCAFNLPRFGPWTPGLKVLASAWFCAVVLAVGIGWSWWWRAPANPTGRLLLVAGVCHCVWMIGRCWPLSSWAAMLTVVGWGTPVTLALVAFGWPTGRPGRRVTTTVLAVVGAGMTLDLVAMAFNRSTNGSPDWPDPALALWSVPEVWFVLDPIKALALAALPSVFVIVWLVRRRRAVPPAVRPLLTPITVAGVLVAADTVFVHVALQLFAALANDGSWDGGFVRIAVLTGDYFQPGFIAIGVWVAGRRRRRAVAVGRRRMAVDLRSAAPIVTPSAAAATLIGDPTAGVRYRRPDRSWVDSSGTPVGGLADDRRLVPVLDGSGHLVAGLDVDAAHPVPPLLADLAVSTIALRSANERAAALAQARRREVQVRSRELVAATDRGRIDLERRLHDGAQQLLVGLALTTGLRARRAPGGVRAGRGETEADEVIRQVRQVRQEILDLIDAAIPAVLSLGLAAALRALLAGFPGSSMLAAAGDLPADDPTALGVYLTAGELVTNAVKHADATHVEVRLTVRADHVVLVVTDDGIGGVPTVPNGVGTRVGALGGTVVVDSPAGAGTTVRIRVGRPDSGGGPS